MFAFGAGPARRIPDGERIPWLTLRVMDSPARSPLIRSFERHLRAMNRSERTVATYLNGLRQADAFLRARGTTIEAASRADLEAFLADLLPAGPLAPPPPTTRSSRSSMPGWPRRRRSRPTPCGA
jgi:hypothetical protein